MQRRETYKTTKKLKKFNLNIERYSHSKTINYFGNDKDSTSFEKIKLQIKRKETKKKYKINNFTTNIGNKEEILKENNNCNKQNIHNDNNKKEQTIKNVEINFLLTYLCSCCIKCFKKKNDDIFFLLKANEMFAEKLDIYNLFHLIINTPKQINEIVLLELEDR